MTFDNLRNLRIIFFEKRKITLKMFEDNFENRFRSHFNHKIDSRMWNNGNGRNVAGNICEIRKVRRNNWRENSRKKKREGEKTVCLRRSQFFNTVSGKYRLSIFSFLVSFQSATRIPFRRIDSTQRVALCILSILLFRIE